MNIAAPRRSRPVVRVDRCDRLARTARPVGRQARRPTSGTRRRRGSGTEPRPRRSPGRPRRPPSPWRAPDPRRCPPRRPGSTASAADALPSCQQRRWSFRGVMPRKGRQNGDRSPLARPAAEAARPARRSERLVNRLGQGSLPRTPRGRTAPRRGGRPRCVGAPARSATVRATLSARSKPRPVRASASTADASSSSARGETLRMSPHERSRQMRVARDAERRVPMPLSFASLLHTARGPQRSAHRAPTPTAPAW